MMKRTIALFIACVALANISFAQGFYGRVGLGYAVPQAGQTMDGTATPYSGTMNNSTTSGVNYTSYDIKNISFTAGMHGAVGVGYMFNRHVGIDASLDFLLSAKQYTLTDGNVSVGGVASNVSIIQQAKATMFIPALVLQSDGDKVNLYTRFGIVLPLSTKVTQDQIFANLPGTGALQIVDYTWEIKNKFALGFSAAAGVKYTLNNRTKIWGEIGFLSFAATTKEANLTEVSVNGQGGYLPQIAADQRKVTYSNSFTTTSTDYYHQPAYSQPFSNFSVNVGLSFDLHKNEAPKQRGRNDVRSRNR